MKNLLRKRVKLLGRSIPLLPLLLISVIAGSALVTVIIQKRTTEQISITATGLIFESAEASVTIAETVLIEYSTYEDSQLTMTSAYLITNNNPESFNMKITPQVPTTTNWDQVSYYKAEIDSIMFLEYSSAVWTPNFFGLMHLTTGTVSIELHTLSGSNQINIEQLYDIELISDDPSQGTYNFASDSYDVAQYYFSAQSLGDGECNRFVGYTPVAYNFDYVLATVSGANITSAGVQGSGNPDYLAYGASGLYHSTFMESIVSANAFYVHIAETDQFVYVPPL